MDTRRPPRILVLGHSFVWRLTQFVAETDLACISSNFHLANTPTVQFYGIGGRTVTKLHQFDLPLIAQAKPTILILEIGSNDLCDPLLTVPNLTANIFQLVQLFHFDYHVPHVIVSQVLPRKTPPVMTPPYNERVQQLNASLHHLLQTTPFATLWFHPSISHSKSSVFLRDGIHLNFRGNHLLYHSYQKALMRQFSRFNHLSTNSRPFVSFRPKCHLHRRHPQNKFTNNA